MNKPVTFLVLLGGLLSVPVMAGQVPTLPSRVLTASGAREVDRIARAVPSKPREAQPAPQQKTRGWIAKHPRLFGALVGFGIGCAVGTAGVGGSGDNFFNALDEFACPAVGGMGAAAGALVGSLVK